MGPNLGCGRFQQLAEPLRRPCSGTQPICVSDRSSYCQRLLNPQAAHPWGWIAGCSCFAESMNRYSSRQTPMSPMRRSAGEESPRWQRCQLPHLALSALALCSCWLRIAGAPLHAQKTTQPGADLPRVHQTWKRTALPPSMKRWQVATCVCAVLCAILGFSFAACGTLKK